MNNLDPIPLNLEVTEKMTADGFYTRYLDWGMKNGILMHQIIMPAAFGPLGIPGVAASADIPANKVNEPNFILKVIIAVPFSMIIS